MTQSAAHPEHGPGAASASGDPGRPLGRVRDAAGALFESVVRHVYNPLTRALRRPARHATTAEPLLRVRDHASTPSDISDHLERLFIETVEASPRLIVELGVRGGGSTVALSEAARVTGAAHVSVDIEDCSGVLDAPGWRFVHRDDIAFAREFPQWCRERGLPEAVDVLFIDTSHLYEHTLQELEHWLPHLAPAGVVFFHDTNCFTGRYVREDGTVAFRPPQTGVPRALSEHFGRDFDWTRDFVEVVDGWVVRHAAACNGLTRLTRVGDAPPPR